MNQQRHFAPIALALCVGAIGLAGCTLQPSDSPNEATVALSAKWSEDVKRIGSDSSNDYVQRVTSDGEITRAELEETFSRLSRCMSDRGYDIEVKVSQDGLNFSYRVPEKLGPEGDGDALTSCQTNSGDLVLTPMFAQIWSNPARVDLDVARADCLRAEGIVDSAFTAQQAQDAWVSLNTTGASSVAQTPAGLACLNNPTGAKELSSLTGVS